MAHYTWAKWNIITENIGFLFGHDPSNSISIFIMLILSQVSIHTDHRNKFSPVHPAILKTTVAYRLKDMRYILWIDEGITLA